MPDDRLGAEPAPPIPGIADRLLQTMNDARRLVVDHLELAALEAQRAADGLVKILCAAIVVSLLIVTAWMALVAGGAIWATNAGFSLPAAMAMAAGVNVVVAVLVGFWIRGQWPDMLFAATLRQLRHGADQENWTDEPEPQQH
jgi:uncharacterized membrane protein YqjE